MSDRVLSTGVARQAITKMQQIINGGLVDQIQSLKSQGDILCDKNNWDGQLATQFSSEWPNTVSALNKAQQQLEELRANVQKINQNIMTAGGNS